MTPIDRPTWEMMWANLQGAGKQMGLNAYASFCDRTKQNWREQFAQMLDLRRRLLRGLKWLN